MESRPLIDAEKPLGVLVDTKSIDHKSNELVDRVLKHSNYDCFRFSRTPEDTTNDLIADLDINTFLENYSEGEHSDWDEFDLTTKEKEILSVLRDLNKKRDTWVLFTERDYIVNNRTNLERSVRIPRVTSFGGRLNILNTTELAEIMGLYLRNNDKFCWAAGDDIEYSHFAMWYQYLFMNCIPHFNYSKRGFSASPHIYVGDDEPHLAGFKSRMAQLLLGLDLLGFEYYKGMDARTNFLTEYHFDHCISLITGIFDTLALHANHSFNIGYDEDDISLNTMGNNSFLNDEIKSECRDLWEYIHPDYAPFINLIHLIRNEVVHGPGVISRSHGGEGYFNERDTYFQSFSVTLDRLNDKNVQKLDRYYQELDDSPLENDPLTLWGISPPESTSLNPDDRETPVTIEPFRFLKKAVSRTIEFSDGYYKILGNEGYEERFSADDPYYNNLLEFSQGALTLLHSDRYVSI